MFGTAKPARQATRTLQTLRGIGQVFVDNAFLCEARYSVNVNQTIVYSGSQRGAGVTDMRGLLVLVDCAHQWRPGTKLSLKLEDGRLAACITTGRQAAVGVYAVQIKELSKSAN